MSELPARRIRPLQAIDLPVLAALHGGAFPHDSWDARALADLLAMPGSRGWLAECGEPERPVGFLLIRRAVDEAEILTFGIDPRERRQGHGAALLDTCLQDLQAEGVARLFLEVAVDNAPARRLYESRRFTAVGRRPRYLEGPQGPLDALVLVRLLLG